MTKIFQFLRELWLDLWYGEDNYDMPFIPDEKDISQINKKPRPDLHLESRRGRKCKRKLGSVYTNFSDKSKDL